MDTPMLDRLYEVQSESMLCSEFLDFIQERYTLFAKNSQTERYIGAGTFINKEQLLAEFFGIDLNQVEQEKMQLLGMVAIPDPATLKALADFSLELGICQNEY